MVYQGIIHKFTLPNTYLVPGVATRVLSPQHLAQQAKDNFPVPGGTGEFTSNNNDFDVATVKIHQNHPTSLTSKHWHHSNSTRCQRF